MTTATTRSQRFVLELSSILVSLIYLLFLAIVVSVILGSNFSVFWAILTVSVFGFIFFAVYGANSFSLPVEAVSARGRLIAMGFIYIFYTTIGRMDDLAGIVPSSAGLPVQVINGALGILVAYYFLTYSVLVYVHGYSEYSRKDTKETEELLDEHREKGESFFKDRSLFLFGIRRALMKSGLRIVDLLNNALLGGVIQFAFNIFRNLVIPLGLSILVLNQTYSDAVDLLQQVLSQTIEMTRQVINDLNDYAESFERNRSFTEPRAGPQ